MKVKVFQPNSHGKIEFTRTELEKLLNEIYDGGFRDGETAQREKSSWTWTPPYVYSDSLTLTNKTNNTNDTNSTNDASNHTQAVAPIIDVFTNLAKELNF